MLYTRMLVLMAVNLYTARIVLNALVVDDYGLYSLVGGVVIFLGVINLSMTASTQRFLSYSHGQDEQEGVSRMFNSVLAVHLLLGIAVFIIGEALGIVYVSYFLNVAPARITAAHIVFQFSLLSFVVKTITVPYHASIIANERMHVFAVCSLIEGGLQLASALAIIRMGGSDKLIWYAAFMFITVFVTQLCYRVYSTRNFGECRFKRNWERKTIKEIFAFSGWNLFGSFSTVAIDQGVNMTLNSFFGVAVNAARGISFQVSGAVSSLSGNMQQALNPQIVKTYAGGQQSENHKILTSGTRLCFCLMILLAAPAFFNMEGLLSLWLGDVPDYTTGFCQWVIGIFLISSLSGCLITEAMATGNIKRYQLTVATINIANLPLSIIALHFYHDPYITFYLMAALGALAFMARLWLTSRMAGFSISSFVKGAILPSLYLTTTITVLCLVISKQLPTEGIIWLIFNCCICFLIAAGSIIAIGLTSNERKKLIAIIKTKMPCCGQVKPEQK